MSLPYNRKLITRARELRRDMTKQEKHLWYEFLRTHNIRFQRQKTINGFIVDFYCHKAKLVIELDGSQHFEDNQLVYDEQRTQILEGYDLKIIRFTNFEIDNNFYDVCYCIDQIISKRLQ